MFIQLYIVNKSVNKQFQKVSDPGPEQIMSLVSENVTDTFQTNQHPQFLRCCHSSIAHVYTWCDLI